MRGWIMQLNADSDTERNLLRCTVIWM